MLTHEVLLTLAYNQGLQLLSLVLTCSDLFLSVSYCPYLLVVLSRGWGYLRTSAWSSCPYYGFHTQLNYKSLCDFPLVWMTPPESNSYRLLWPPHYHLSGNHLSPIALYRGSPYTGYSASLYSSSYMFYQLCVVGVAALPTMLGHIPFTCWYDDGNRFMNSQYIPTSWIQTLATFYLLAYLPLIFLSWAYALLCGSHTRTISI